MFARLFKLAPFEKTAMHVFMANYYRLYSQVVVIPLIAILNGCGTNIEAPTALETKEEAPAELEATTVPDKPLSSITDHEWDECQKLAEKSIKRDEAEPGSGLGDTGERIAYTYGGAIGAIIALISAKSRSPETGTEEQTEKRYYTYWNTLKECLRYKGYAVSDDSVEVERP